jgi:hypothetical protein
MSYSYQETLNGESLSRYKAKLSVVNCKECPYKLPAGVWENNPCMWPVCIHANLVRDVGLMPTLPIYAVVYRFFKSSTAYRF